jgi:hypothetical protein
MSTEKTLQVFTLPVFTRKELESILNALTEIIDDIYYSYANIKREMEMIADRVVDTIYYASYPRIKELEKRVQSKIEELDEFIRKLVDDIVTTTLNLDDDLSKWEDVFNVVFENYERRILGLAILEEGGELTPVVITTDYIDFFIEPIDEYY